MKKKYKSVLNNIETENAIKFVKDTFQKKLSETLQLQRVTAPLFVKSSKVCLVILHSFQNATIFYFFYEVLLLYYLCP